MYIYCVPFVLHWSITDSLHSKKDFGFCHQLTIVKQYTSIDVFKRTGLEFVVDIVNALKPLYKKPKYPDYKDLIYKPQYNTK